MNSAPTDGVPPEPARRPPGGPEYGPLLEASRRLLDAVAGADAPDDVVRAATAMVRSAYESLEPYEVDELRSPAGRRRELPGRGHPILAPYVPELFSADESRGTVLFTRAHLGQGGAIHGGVIPLLFDELLGHLATRGGGRPPSRTAYLRVDYRDLTPVGVELTAEARIDRIEGRKIFAVGVLREGPRVCAEANGLFVMLRPDQVAGRFVRSTPGAQPDGGPRQEAPASEQSAGGGRI